MAKNWLNGKGIAYEEINIDNETSAREFVISEGHRTMPQIYVDGKSIGGYQQLIQLNESAFN